MTDLRAGAAHSLLSPETIATARQFIAGLASIVREFQSGIFALLGIFFGAWLSRRSELMRFRIERRTQILDQTAELTARYYTNTWGRALPGFPTSVEREELMFAVMSLNAKIAVHFSPGAYQCWRDLEKMFATGLPVQFTATDFSEARAAALKGLARELK